MCHGLQKRRPQTGLSNLLRIRLFAAMDFAHEHALDQDHLVVGSLTAACSNACA
ncbi:hypothetical protein X765_04875 [Mesorhizobium sp. LSHC440B00]|nr:hypothetical protein X770_00500 [Mesorhizobium sp. LSJC269B00]ESX16684.1 hypothetical protein X766_21475 [Mesorhizobium sp. LSJC255A00]ESX27826.1 hypothetical protein X767_02390 [Mesorhizobium sp. LSJC264A00]ESX32903.1 hypothetical protein X765_04875 [Mesorhizobium sp. LSHC440B00]ESX44919.1 hypothetical protein X764_02560 [Mesorhizobium sp. LSHC440A00]ESX91291.1 hypothetical protein X756_01805 [Mesorhizobium sp. LSHC412B00]ESX94490.1 hypothetical protein X754_14490 [Mesorhizobium sp. LNJC4